MLYPRIIALIDQRIDQLMEARALLSSRVSAEWFLQNINAIAAEAEIRPVRSEEPMSSGTETVAAVPETIDRPKVDEVTKQRLPAVRRRATRSSQHHTRRQAATALSSAAPAGPVFVPASRVLEMQTVKVKTAADPTEELSPEERAKRWLLGR